MIIHSWLLVLLRLQVLLDGYWWQLGGARQIQRKR